MVQNVELYLISMIPFMRGYANIANKKDIFEALTQVMHGYKSESVDIAQAYIELFGNPDNLIPSNYAISVPDILLKSVDAVTIVDPSSFPLLNRTLKHSFQYLYLRLAVEKALVDKFYINTDQNSQLGQIISAAFPDDNDIEQIRSRIRLARICETLNCEITDVIELVPDEPASTGGKEHERIETKNNRKQNWLYPCRDKVQ